MIRKPNAFEIAVLIVGLIITFLGVYFIHQALILENFYYLQVLQVIFLWTLLIGLMIVLAVNENVKEELKQVISLQSEELRLIKKEMKDYFGFRKAYITKRLRKNK